MMRHALPLLAGLLVLLTLAAPGPLYAQTLKEALSLKEYPRGKTDDGAKTIDSSTQLPELDFASRLVIEPDTQRLRTMVSATRPVLPPRTAADQTRLDSLPALLEAAQEFIDEAARVAENVKAARETNTPLSPAQIADLQQQISRKAAMNLRILRPIRAIAEAQAREIFPSPAEQDKADSLVIVMTEPLFADEQGNPVLLNVQALAAFLREHLSDAERQIGEDAETAARQGTAQFRMRAWLSQGSDDLAAISITNYDNITLLAAPKRSRVAFRLTPAEQSRLAQGFALSTVANSFIRDVRGQRFSLRNGLESLRQLARQELQNLQALPTEVPIDTTSIQLALDVALPQASGVQQNNLQDLRTFLRGFHTTLFDIKTGISALQADSPDAEALINRFLALPTEIARSLRLALNYTDEIRRNAARLPLLDTVLRQTPDAGAFQTQLETVLPQTEQTLTTFANEHLARYSQVARLLTDVANRQQVVHMGDMLEDIPVDTRVLALDLDSVGPGEIDLDATAADEGDKVSVKAELFTVDAEGREAPIESAVITFEVRRFGLTSELATHLILVDRADGDSSQYDPATSASWTLHYRPRLGPTASGLAKAWAFLDPGLGLNVAALDFDGGTFQIGLGAHATLFDDLLAFGYGSNLFADDKKGYYYLGIGLLETFDLVGGLFRR